MTHIIRIAMSYHGQLERGVNDEEETDGGRRSRPEAPMRNELAREDACCNSVNGALDFTLNCNGLRLTSRDRNLRTAGGGRQQGPETRD